MSPGILAVPVQSVNGNDAAKGSGRTFTWRYSLTRAEDLHPHIRLETPTAHRYPLVVSLRHRCPNQAYVKGSS
jgi:hypothetical protein